MLPSSASTPFPLSFLLFLLNALLTYRMVKRYNNALEYFKAPRLGVSLTKYSKTAHASLVLINFTVKSHHTRI
jgi:hypothetical protein